MRTRTQLHRSLGIAAALAALLAWQVAAADTQVNINTPAGAVNASVTLGTGSGGDPENGDKGKPDPGDSDSRHWHHRAPVPEPALWIALGSLLLIGLTVTTLDRKKDTPTPPPGVSTP